MSHMPRYGSGGSGCSDSGSCGGRLVRYTATGSESPSGFTVPIGATLADTDYYPSFHSVEDDVIVPVAWSFPSGSKTTSQFQARFAGDALTAGAVYIFEISEG